VAGVLDGTLAGAMVGASIGALYGNSVGDALGASGDTEGCALVGKLVSALNGAALDTSDRVQAGGSVNRVVVGTPEGTSNGAALSTVDGTLEGMQ
jgi:hypothetical protein